MWPRRTLGAQRPTPTGAQPIRARRAAPPLRLCCHGTSVSLASPRPPGARIPAWLHLHLAHHSQRPLLAMPQPHSTRCALLSSDMLSQLVLVLVYFVPASRPSDVLAVTALPLPSLARWPRRAALFAPPMRLGDAPNRAAAAAAFTSTLPAPW